MAPQGTVLYSDNFSGDAKGSVPSGWSVFGSNAGFSVANDAGRVYAHSGWTASTAEYGWTGTNYTLQVDVKPCAWASEQDGIDVRYHDAQDFYSVRFVGGSQVVIGKMVNNGNFSGNWTVLASAPLAYAAAWHHVTVAAYGSTLTVWVDGVQRLTATDTQFASGVVGLDGNAPVEYDNVRVTA